MVAQDHLPSFWAAADIALVPERMADRVTYAQALRMGVPLVCWSGSDLERVQNAVLETPLMAADDLIQYGAIAAHLAQDVVGLSLMRKDIVARAEHAAPFDAKVFADTLEAKMRQCLTAKAEQDPS